MEGEMQSLEQSWQGLLLIGGFFVVLFTVVFFPVIYKIVVGRKGAARMDAEGPVLCERLGLREPRHKLESDRDVLKYEGELDGYRVEVDSSTAALVEVDLKRPINCELSMRDRGLRPRRGQEEFSFGDALLDGLFVVRHASPKARAWFTGSGEGLGELREFVRRRRKDLAHFDIEGTRMSARFKHGWEIKMEPLSLATRDRHGRPYCLTEDLEELLRALPRIARELDSTSPEDDPIIEDDDF